MPACKASSSAYTVLACMLVRLGVLPGYTALAGCKRFGDGMSLLGLQPDSPVPLPSGDGYR